MPMTCIFHTFCCLPNTWNCFSLTLFVVINLSFSQSTYSVDEDKGPAQPVLVLSNPSSTDIPVQVTDTPHPTNTAISE